ncbi:alanine racemase [Methyloligella sp. GL2]|nr:alanine racemase [Methyloligella sp. GL2]
MKTAPAVLTIDLDALAANYRFLRDRAAPAECAAVVKADAYGLGVDKVAPVLWNEGCRSFFVATLGEALTLRALLPEAIIYVFDGLLPGTAPVFAENAIRPVLNSADEIAEWAAFCAETGAKHPAAIHIDTGMNRLGLSGHELEQFLDGKTDTSAFALTLVMSHLACADTPEHPANAAQQTRFAQAISRLPQVTASLANSGGVVMGADYHFDLVRPGIALYGGQPSEACEHRFQTVVTLSCRILQIREAGAGETVGYGATKTLQAPTRIATIAAGYADGLSWLLSAGDAVDGLHAYLGPHAAPILGRVSMDLVTLDVTGIPETHAKRGAFAEVIGPNVPLETLAGHASTVNYEVLTNICRRALRRFIGGEG